MDPLHVTNQGNAFIQLFFFAFVENTEDSLRKAKISTNHHYLFSRWSLNSTVLLVMYVEDTWFGAQVFTWFILYKG
jgi:hypothetical protein